MLSSLWIAALPAHAATFVGVTALSTWSPDTIEAVDLSTFETTTLATLPFRKSYQGDAAYDAALGVVYLFEVGFDQALWSFELSTGELLRVGEVGPEVVASAVVPATGELLAVDGYGEVFLIDPTTASARSVGQTGQPFSPGGWWDDARGALIARVDQFPDPFAVAVYPDGQSTPVGGLTGLFSAADADVDPSTGQLWGVADATWGGGMALDAASLLPVVRNVNLHAYAGLVFVGDDATPALRRAAGACPGTLTLDLGRLTPLGDYAVLASRRPGAAAIPGAVCGGSSIALIGPRLVARGTASVAGTARLQPTLSAAVCAEHLQVVDLTTCAASSLFGL